MTNILAFVKEENRHMGPVWRQAKAKIFLLETQSSKYQFYFIGAPKEEYKQAFALGLSESLSKKLEHTYLTIELIEHSVDSSPAAFKAVGKAVGEEINKNWKLKYAKKV